MDDFDCPISKERMKDPVITPNGDTYDRVNIEEWIRSQGTDPCTRAPLAVHELIPNRALKNIIETLFPPEVVHTPASSSSAAAAASSSNPQPMRRTGSEPRQVWVMRGDFDGKEYGPEYLVVREGDELQLLPQTEDGWSMGRVLCRKSHHTEATGSPEEGWFPADYVQLKEEATSSSAARERMPSPSPAASQVQLDRAWQRATDRARALPSRGFAASIKALNLQPLPRHTAASNNRAAIPRDGNSQAPAAAAASETVPSPAPASQDAVAGAAMQMPLMQMPMAAPPSSFSAPSAGLMYYMYVPGQRTEGDVQNMSVPVMDAGGMAGVAMQMPMMQMQTVPAMQAGGEMMMLVGAAAAADVPAAASAPTPLAAAAAASPSPSLVPPTPKRKGLRNVSIGRKPAAKPAAVWLGEEGPSSGSAAAAAAPTSSQAAPQERSLAPSSINPQQPVPHQQQQFMTLTMPQQLPAAQMLHLQAPQFPAMLAPVQLMQMPEVAEQHGVEPPASAPAAPKKKGLKNLALVAKDS